MLLILENNELKNSYSGIITVLVETSVFSILIGLISLDLKSIVNKPLLISQHKHSLLLNHECKRRLSRQVRLKVGFSSRLLFKVKILTKPTPIPRIRLQSNPKKDISLI